VRPFDRILRLTVAFAVAGFFGGVFVRAEKKHSANVCNLLVKILLWLQSVFSLARGFWKKHSGDCPLALPLGKAVLRQTLPGLDNWKGL
jgi:hypothetical protein